MFKQIEAAAEVLSGLAEETLIAALIGLLLPVIVFEPVEDEIKDPLTFMGGAPVWSAQQTWPVPPLPDDIEAIAARGGDAHRQYIQQSLETRLPYAFLGQINLAGKGFEDLPNTGRLLFFYDIFTGPWDTGTRAAHVIWDDTAEDTLVATSVPSALLQAEADAKQELLSPSEVSQQIIDALRQSGMTEAEIAEFLSEPEESEQEDMNFYLGPKRFVRPHQMLQFPSPFALEWDAFVTSVGQASGQSVSSDDLWAVYDAVHHRLWERTKGDNKSLTDAFQLGGSPNPEQDDPRYSAATHLVLGKEFLDEGEWERHEAALMQTAHDLRLLFQVSVPAWLGSKTEGTIYFVIRYNDLKDRRFDKAIAVYQQT